ncbi:hypothetical protein W824_15050 [Clavibacter cf. michiganensis LMG 26808]|nr:hypothetical protein W824_15050 [Clavibacter cf. michiganensis LMG 26808]
MALQKSDQDEEQHELLPQQELELLLLEPLVAPVSGTATASRTDMISTLSKSRSGRLIFMLIVFSMRVSHVRCCVPARVSGEAKVTPYWTLVQWFRNVDFLFRTP